MYFNFDNSYPTLKPEMYSIIKNTKFGNPEYVVYNDSLAKVLGLDESLKSDEGAKYITGFSEDIKYAQAYGGHQFGHFSILGDGRAFMLGEHINNNIRTDIHIKGSGRTPYSRTGDGKGTLYSMLREYIISEALFYLNIPTTRTLAVLKTNELINRSKPEPGGLLVRTAKSHIRVGTFQFAATESEEHVKQLFDYTVNRHFKHLEGKTNKPIHFLREVMESQIKLIVKWQSFGFIHGVMNTDNMLISGESIDYGPCAFMDAYDPETVFSSIDRNGRYKYSNQPYMASFNIVKLAETLLPLIDKDIEKAASKLNEVISRFEKIYKKEYLRVFSNKLGIRDENDFDKTLVDEFHQIMFTNKLDFTNTYKKLTLRELDVEFEEWIQKWKKITDKYNATDVTELMENNNPVIIPRNHIVEEAITKASMKNDYEPLDQIMEMIKSPFDYEKIIDSSFTEPELMHNYKTYCGT